jgi:hypothetical protein
MKATLALVLSSLTAFAIGCGSSSSNGSGSQNQLVGSWSITTTDGVNGDSGTIQATLIGGSDTNINCTFQVPDGDGFFIAMEHATSCAIADNQTGQGSISGTGDFFYPPVAVMAWATGNQVNLFFVESNGPVTALFDAAGTTGNGTISGSWQCDASSPTCTGLGGTFTGAKI